MKPGENRNLGSRNRQLRRSIPPKKPGEKPSASASTGAATHNTGSVASGRHAKADCRIPIWIIAIKKDGGGAIPPKKPGEKPSASASTGAATQNTGSVASGSHAKADCRIPIRIIAKKDGGGAIPSMKPGEKPSASASTGAASQNTSSASGSHAKADCRIPIRIPAKKGGRGAIPPKKPGEKATTSAPTRTATQNTGSVATGSHAKVDCRSSIRIFTKKDVGGAISPNKSIKKVISSASSGSSTQNTGLVASESHETADCRIPIRKLAKKDGGGASSPKKPGESATTPVTPETQTSPSEEIATGKQLQTTSTVTIRKYTRKMDGKATLQKKRDENEASASGNYPETPSGNSAVLRKINKSRAGIRPSEPSEKVPGSLTFPNTESTSTNTHGKTSNKIADSRVRQTNTFPASPSTSGPAWQNRNSLLPTSDTEPSTSSDTGGVSSSVPPRKSATKAMVTTNRETASGGRNADTDNHNQSVSLKTNGNIRYA